MREKEQQLIEARNQTIIDKGVVDKTVKRINPYDDRVLSYMKTVAVRSERVAATKRYSI